MDRENKAKIIAVMATIIVVALCVILMLILDLRYTGDEPRKWPPEDTSELLLEGEYVAYGDIPQPQQTDPTPAAEAESEATLDADDLYDSGEPAAEASPVISNTQESPMKVKEKPKPEKTGPSAAELAEQEKIKKQKEAAEMIKNRVNFGGAQSGTGTTGTSGSPNGNSTTGALSGMPGTNLKGRTLASWEKPSGSETGTIVISVWVNRQGRVIRAVYSSGRGAIASSAAARRNCEQAALRSKFSVDLDAPAEQSGTITYRFE